jgi:hypothetical protein
MIVNGNMLGVRMKYGIDREIDSVNGVTPKDWRVNEKNTQVFSILYPNQLSSDISKDLYSASMLDRAIVDCFFELQEIKSGPRKTR